MKYQLETPKRYSAKSSSIHAQCKKMRSNSIFLRELFTDYAKYDAWIQ